MQIQTIHSAKGLEYPIVFICGLDYGYYQSDYEENACAVERNISDA
jgi:superfamily I DNA/RNA helicase